MALAHVGGIDHVVVLTADLAGAARRWEGLGFTLSPRGTHSAHLGTGNHTIMLGPDYVELMGILAETPHNAPGRAFLARRGEGLERVALRAFDAERGAEEIRARGFEPVGPIAFGRPVPLPGGGEAEAAFRVFFWPHAAAPGDVRLFACQHLTPETVWLPDLQRHANGAERILRVEILARDPAGTAAHLGRLVDRAPERDGDAFRVASGEDRADFVVLDQAALARRHPGIALGTLPEEGGAALVLATSDLDAAVRALGETGIRTGRAVAVPPAAANGIVLAFEAA
jgi:hypothetical protein